MRQSYDSFSLVYLLLLVPKEVVILLSLFDLKIVRSERQRSSADKVWVLMVAVWWVVRQNLRHG